MSTQKSITAQQKQKSTTSSCNSMCFELLNLNDRYAESIERDFYKYVSLVIHAIRVDHTGETGTALKFVKENPQFFSVYAKARKGGELECVGDFGGYLNARGYAEELAKTYSWEIEDFAKVIFN